MTTKLQAAQQLRDNAQAALNAAVIQLWEAQYALDQASEWVSSLQCGNGAQPVDAVITEARAVGVNAAAERAFLDYRNNTTAFNAYRAQVRADQLTAINAAS